MGFVVGTWGVKEDKEKSGREKTHGRWRGEREKVDENN